MSRLFSLSNITAGLVAVLVGFTSSVTIIFQAAMSAGASPAEISSWLLALGFGMGVTCIGLSFYYRIPILTAWSTPGAALLIVSLSKVSMPNAIGIFIFSAILIILSGITGFFEKVMVHIPRSLAAAMLAGILLHFGLDIFKEMQQQFFLVLLMVLSYVIARYAIPRFAILIVLLVGILIAELNGLLHLHNLALSISKPILTMPLFSPTLMLSVGLPLFIVTMTSQNMPGVALLRNAGYNPPVSSLITWTGVTNLLLAPFGGFAFNLAALSAAICLSEDADKNPDTRYKAAVYAGIFYLIAGIFGATVVSVFSILPPELVLTAAGLALLPTIGNCLKVAMEHESQLEPALLTFLVTASGVSIFGIGSAFWGLVAGVLTLTIVKYAQRILILHQPGA